MRFSITATVALASALLVGCVHTERAEPMTIRAIRATGETFYTPQPQPIWRFAITNIGTSAACWVAGIEVQGGGDRGYSNAGGHIDWPAGVITPGQGIETNMIVPAKTGSVWRAYVEFWMISPHDLKKSQDDADRFGVSVTEFCPRPESRKELYNEEWHH
jgi:hypothetical protein